VYLPAARHPEPDTSEPPVPAVLPVRGARILLVEDEPAVRDAVRRILERAGYEVTIAGGAEHALKLLTEAADPCDLLLTDVIMPGMWGDELATRARAFIPDLPTLFVSGYGERFLRRGRASAPGPVLVKPVRDDALLMQVATLIGGRRRENGSGPQPRTSSAENMDRSDSAYPRTGGAEVRSV